MIGDNEHDVAMGEGRRACPSFSSATAITRMPLATAWRPTIQIDAFAALPQAIARLEGDARHDGDAICGHSTRRGTIAMGRLARDRPRRHEGFP